MTEKGKLIGVRVNSKEDITSEKCEILKTAQVIFAHNIIDQTNKALEIATPTLEERPDYKILMLVKPVFSTDTSEEYLKNSWDVAAKIISQYLDTGRNVAFLALEDIDESDFRYVDERLSEEYIIEKIN